MRAVSALLFGLALFLLLQPIRSDEPVKTGFISAVYKNADGESKYVVFVPASYKGDREFPAILFLHGAGETGNDGKLQLKHFGDEVKKRQADFPFIVVFPQSHKRTWKADSSDGKRAIAILDEVMKKYKVDANRVYLTGLSMGGYGTWSLAAAYPDRWAAIVPICGGGDPKTAEKIKHLPCWCFHGDADKAVPVQRSREMIEALKKVGGSPRYDEYPGVGHNSWSRAYATDELYTWLLKQKRK